MMHCGVSRHPCYFTYLPPPPSSVSPTALLTTIKSSHPLTVCDVLLSVFRFLEGWLFPGVVHVAAQQIMAAWHMADTINIC